VKSKPEGAAVMAQRVTIQRIAAIAAVLIASPIAHAEPVHLSCDGFKRIAKGKFLENDIRSLTIDLAADTVTIDGSGPLGIIPMPDQDKVLFTALPQQHLLVEHGSLNRITGKVFVKYTDGVLYSGICKVGHRLF
jgi:hypothetical protein